jgi:hypothetical protein
MQDMNSLYYQAIDQKNNTVILNKKYIVSVRFVSQFDTEVIMTTGQTYHLNLVLGDLMAHLGAIGHTQTD